MRNGSHMFRFTANPSISAVVPTQLLLLFGALLTGSSALAEDRSDTLPEVAVGTTGTAVSIDEEVKRILTESYDKAKSIIEEHIAALHRLAKALLERESLDADEIDRVLKGEELPKVSAERRPEEPKEERGKVGEEIEEPGKAPGDLEGPQEEPAISLKGQEETGS